MTVSKVPHDPSLSKEMRTFLDGVAKAETRITAALPSFASQAEAEAGTSTTVMMSPARTVEAIAAFSPFANALLHVQDQKANNTSGGNFVFGAWRTRDLNTVLTNEISGASLSANRITVPAGTYWIEASATAFQVSDHTAKLRNITAGSDVLIGTSEVSAVADAVSSRSFVSGRFTVAGSTALELQHSCLQTGLFGRARDLGVAQVFADVKIWKLD